MGKIIQIEVPEEISSILNKDALLKKFFKKTAVESFKEKLLKYLIAEELTKDINVSEEEILKIDEEIKESAWKELKKKWKLQ